ncbi:MAG: 4,5-DOPA dioxygenase extradiol [Sphingobacteriales bacterium]|uniref:4,5-DOPA-extradiol-dioxygenase n=1 Tax=Hydrotalea flava TaxID=714549 RepID=UPI00082C1195|nr:4,5-DOPA dioxygenase extradiol [Hydrotalea flava]RTL47639.1 MAG: 4,5-DOPA dioxygenase extradiol [Sphingobacteriales bacterium]
MTTYTTFQHMLQTFPEQESLMPVFFIGHGSPMNGIETNIFSQNWADMAKHIPLPKAIIVISAHWQTKGTQITAMDFPPTIHDFGGFPEALYQVQYPAPGQTQLAEVTKHLVKSTEIGLDHEWGLDHGAWTVLRHMYPQANIPVLQLSIDYTKDARYHFELAKELQALRKRGVLMIGSGNMVHNLRMVNWQKLNEPGFAYDWATEINETFKTLILQNNASVLIHYEQLGTAARLAIPTPEHYIPLMYTMGLRNDNDATMLFNDQAIGGSLTMTSVKLG